MLNVITTVIRWWVYLGIGFLPVLIVMETAASMIRGPEYALWVQRNRTEMNLKVSPLKMVLVWLFIWPLIFVHWLQASWAKMTLTEYSIRAEIRKREHKEDLQRQSFKAHRALREALGATQGHVWFSPFVAGLGVQPYIRAVARQAVLVCTHLVVKMPDGMVVAVRIGTIMAGDPPDTNLADDEDQDFADHDMALVVRWCDEDRRWNELCEEGTDAQRRLYQQGMIA